MALRIAWIMRAEKVFSALYRPAIEAYEHDPFRAQLRREMRRSVAEPWP